MALEARCSHCDYRRQFAPELGGRYYRCPSCREGVLAVPRASAEDQEAWRADQEAWLERSATSLAAEAARAVQRALELEEEEESRQEASAPGSSVEAEASPPDYRGQVGSARRLLVECGLCGFLVRVPPSFFGKTIHCPECRGDTVFSESVLEPVKDELLDRLLLESRERHALLPEPGGAARARAWRSFGVGAGAGLVALGLIGGGLLLKRTLRRAEALQRAADEGWRYAADPAALLLHDPWCAELPGSFERLPAAELEAALAAGHKRHDCR